MESLIFPGTGTWANRNGRHSSQSGFINLSAQNEIYQRNVLNKGIAHDMTRSEKLSYASGK